MNDLYRRIADLPLTVESVALEPLALDVPDGWTRRTTVVRLAGAGLEGLGEDVNYDGDEQRAFAARGAVDGLAGSTTVAGFSEKLDAHPLLFETGAFEVAPLYRRWAFEAAALDLALRQARRTLSEALGRPRRPLTFVLSLGLGDPPSTRPLARRRAIHSDARFKVDFAESWTAETVDALAAHGGVATVDFKGCYRGAFRGPQANPALYRRVAEALPRAILEDPAREPEALDALAPFAGRVAWDAPIHALSDALQLPFPPRAMNVKPSRFGTLSELFRFYAWCENRGIAMYGGGQFELGPGRTQIQELAALFHPDGDNDVAPAGYNDPRLEGELPASPLPPPDPAPGFGAG